MRFASIFLVFAGSAMCGEYVVLATGARLHADRHEIGGGKVRLFANGGVTELDSTMVTGFEREDYVAPPPAPAEPPAAAPKPAKAPRELADDAARRYGIPPEFIRSVVAAESGFQANAISSKGAIGLMQLMPGTAKDYGANPHDPAENVDAGARLLRDLLLKYKDDPFQVRRALAAYNAGPGAVSKYNGIPPYRETQAYVGRIIRNWRKASEHRNDVAAASDNAGHTGDSDREKRAEVGINRADSRYR